MANLLAPQVAERLLALLPTDGTPVLNRVMRIMLARELRQPVASDLYFKACDLLLQRGKIGRSRGQGGHVFYLAETATQAVAPPRSPDRLLESHLMEPLRRYLDGPFRDGLALPPGGIGLLKDTSRMGPSTGRWARPDFVMVTAMRFRLMPGVQVDVHSFELKSETGASDLAVYEALAQTRFTHFGHLVWHLPAGSRAEARLQEIERQCDAHGIGLIRMHDPDHPEGCDILLDPVRKDTLAADVDGFLESRLDEAEQRALRAVLNGEPA